MIAKASRPVIISGGGVLYSEAEDMLAAFVERHNFPFVETQAGKGASPPSIPLNFGSPGVTGSDRANELCMAADLRIGVGTRFQDFTTDPGRCSAMPGASSSPSTFTPTTRASILPSFRLRRQRGAGTTFQASGTCAAAHDPGAKTAWLGEIKQVTDPPRADANACSTRRSSARSSARPRRTPLRCARPAPCPAAGAVAGREGRLPHGIRLFLHGLRAGRRDGDQDRRAREGRGLLRGDGYRT